jgi:aminopeptidase N
LLKDQEKNVLTLHLLNKYRRDGVGLHSFIDKIDSQQYTYTQFEADFCHYVFPCFDQPDLKATWSFSAITDGDWQVISNEAQVDDENRLKLLESETSEAADLFKDTSEFKVENANKFVFQESFKISTYLYAIVAGPFDYHER